MFKNNNELNRQEWLKAALSCLPSGMRILDAGAGELKNQIHCSHLEYVSQDFCQYAVTGGTIKEGLQSSGKIWDTTRVDIVSDITSIPAPDHSFDAILCSEVLEHVAEPSQALNEFTRLLKPGGVLILTAPFASNVHMAPYFYCTGFSKYWYEHHLSARGFVIQELVPHGDWFALLQQELCRLGGMERQKGSWTWPLAYVFALLGICYFRLRPKRTASDVACFGWNCVARKSM